MAETPEITPSASLDKDPQLPPNGYTQSPNGNTSMFPTMYPLLIPGLVLQPDENHGPGLYAVGALPYMQPFPGFSSNTLIPFTYNIPTERSASGPTAVGGEQGQVVEQQQQAAQRQVLGRRFQFAFQLDLLLILKLAAVIFLFNHDGSRSRLTLLVLLASLVYLYQTGALAPLIRWLTQGMQRAAAPPQPPRPPVRADDVPPAGRQGNENAPDGQPGVGNENQQVNDGDRPVENEHGAENGGGEAGNRWLRIVKEIQIFFFGFIASLLPGFHNID